ncbi:hypothetical protein RND81_09G016500 [Saponaria officinalis]|uniref:SWIM-type domain-containing protein n=1 Tax=Saponaria officinalis TaxID=3572 RepID=A0AAW1IGU5_SAPOF
MTDTSPIDVVEEIPAVASTSFTPTCTPEEIDNMLSLHSNYTPGGSEQWMRKVEMEFTPKCGMFFNTMKDGLEFYRIYALACGFDVRLYTSGTLNRGAVTLKSIVCNRQGFRDINRQRRVAHTTLCEVGSSNREAQQPKKQRQPKKKKLRRCGCQAKMRLRSCEKRGFIVDQLIHNHALYSVKNREFQKLSRNLSLYHKKTIIDHSKVNIGPTKSFRIVKEYSNGYQNMGASLMEFKNNQRDVKCYIGDNDAAMFIGNFQKLAETRGLYFAYEVDDTKCLTRVFGWTRKQRETILYNNKISVTFRAGLLSFEDEESFTWMFLRFLEAMGGKEPQCIITDQDPAIKNACPAVFKTARYKFCMWHIMQKMNDKVGKTRSESENSYFKRFENHFGTLVEFWMRFTSAIEQQRHTQRQLDTENEHAMPHTITPLKLEQHASVIYTHTVFSEFQEEVRQSFCSLGIAGFNKNGNMEYHDVDDGVRNRKYRVRYNADTKVTACACKLFERRCFLCRHILWVWAGRKMYSIPDMYILQRWTKKSYRPVVCDSSGKADEDIDEADIRRVEMSKAWSEIYATMGLLDTAPHKNIKQLTKILK